MKRPRLHRGLHYKRADVDRARENVTLETAFADEWEAVNARCPGLNHGYGVLQDLMFGFWDSRVCSLRAPSRLWARFRISRRDACIAATVVQWLGTNGGRAFMGAVFDRAGYRLVSIRDMKRWAEHQVSAHESRNAMALELLRLRRMESLLIRQREELERALAETRP